MIQYQKNSRILTTHNHNCASTTCPDEAAIAENAIMHADAVRQSEQLFYGFFGEGFENFDTERSPSDWISYSLNLEELPADDELPDEPTTSKNISDSLVLLQLNRRIIPPPFTTNDLARVSQSPILTAEECSEIISECENHHWGWGSSQERYSTPAHKVGHMLKLEDLSRSYSLVNFELLPRLFPAIANAFQLLETRPENLRLGGCRVVKYDASKGRVELGLHRDGLLVTANIALNDLGHYEGGGTIIEGMPSFESNPIQMPEGHVLLHPGDVRHGGAPITKGIRYVLVCFILDSTLIPHEKYCQDRVKRDVEAAQLIDVTDQSRKDERERLLESATKHFADACYFGR